MTTFTRALVRPPAQTFAAGLTTVDLGAPNHDRALQQHERYCAALERCGLTLTRLESDPAYPDSTFVEDTAILTERCAILTRPGAPSRVAEVASIHEVLCDLFPSWSSIQSPGTVDGGDICEASEHFFIGISERTNEGGARQLAQILASYDYTSSFVDIRGVHGILHLKSGLAYLGDQRLAIIDSLAGRSEFVDYDPVLVNDDEKYAANCVRINNHVLVAAGYPGWEDKLTTLGYQTIALDVSEFQKMDGGLSCLSLRF
jgi:dimethylargininase